MASPSPGRIRDRNRPSSGRRAGHGQKLVDEMDRYNVHGHRDFVLPFRDTFVEDHTRTGQ